MVGLSRGFRFESVKDINSMTKNAETIHIGEALAESLDQDKLYQAVRTMVGDSGTVVRPSASARRLYQVLTLIRIALVLTFILVAAASVFAD